MKLRLQDRYDQVLRPDSAGTVFVKKDGEKTEFSSLRVCGVVVDTVRQLYRGIPDRQIINTFKGLTLSGPMFLDRDDTASSGSIIYRRLCLPMDSYQVSRMGRAGRYRYKLQNAELGVVVLFGLHFGDLASLDSHLKIELSPHFIQGKSPTEVQRFMDLLAKCLLSDCEPSGVALHLAVDFQNWSMPRDMTDFISTRSKFVRDYTGVASVSAHSLDSVISRFNRDESVLVGKAGGLQMALYRKDLQMVKVDAVDYYHDLYGRYTEGEYEPDQPVNRLEFRFHHTIVDEFSKSCGTKLLTYEICADYLTNLWRYGLSVVRYTTFCEEYYEPLWQVLLEDIVFGDVSAIDQSDFVRSRVVKNDTRGIARNVNMMIGNLISIHARTTRSPRQIVADIKRSPALYDPLKAYLLNNGFDSGAFFQSLEHKILLRRASSKFAAYT